MIDFTNFDALGQPIKTTEACGTNDYRDQLFGWHPSGLMEFLILENPDTGQQVTQWLFGSTLDTSEVAQNGVIVGKVYPTGESSTNTVNRQGEVNTHTQPNGTNHQITRNKVGAVIHDAVTALGPDIDDTVLRISSVFNNRGLIETISSWNNATIGAGNIINQVKRVYDAFNQPIEDQQEHTGAVDANTPAVTYGFTDGSNNTLRPTSIATPSGQQTDINYGAAGSIHQTFNRPAALKIAGESGNLVDYEYAGLAMVTNVTYPGPDVELALATAGTIGDAGDSLTGFDAFNRIIDMPWKKESTSAVLAQIGYGYDQASRRKWRQDLTPQANNLHDQFFGYDKLSQVKSAARGTLNNNRTEIGAIPTEEEGWEYDETGNWLEYQRAEAGTQTIEETRTHNTSNQIKAVDGTNAGIAYDTNGNMTRVPTGSGLQGPARTLKWDAWDRMVEVRKQSDNSLIAKYAYDGLTRRTTLTDSTNEAKHFYYNADWRAVEERIDASTDPSKVYYWGAQDRWELVRRDRDSNGNGTLDETLYCLRDAMDPIAIVDSSGAVQERFQYTAFGEVTFLTGDYSLRNASNFDWGFLFHGEFRDEETGYYNYGFRYYSPELGQWLNRDPIEEVVGDVNLYAFVGNDGVGKLDIRGLISMEAIECCGDKIIDPYVTRCCNGKPYRYRPPNAKCCDKYGNIKDENAGTGVFRNDYRYSGGANPFFGPDHVTISYPGGAVGAYPGKAGIFGGYDPTAGADWNRDLDYSFDPKKKRRCKTKSKEVKLSECKYDIAKFVSCISSRSTHTALPFGYFFGTSDCRHFATQLIEHCKSVAQLK